jgi:hypothetical protein
MSGNKVIEGTLQSLFLQGTSKPQDSADVKYWFVDEGVFVVPAELLSGGRGDVLGPMRRS